MARKPTKAQLRTAALERGEEVEAPVTPAPPAESQPAPPASHEEPLSSVTPEEPRTMGVDVGSSPSFTAVGVDVRPGMCIIAVPLGDIEPGAYCPQHVEMRLFEDSGAARSLKRLLAGLVERGERLPPTTRHPFGKAVNSYADALRWVLRQIANQAEPAALPAAEDLPAAA